MGPRVIGCRLRGNQTELYITWKANNWACAQQTNKMTCTPSEVSDQPGLLPSLISLRCPHEETWGPQLPIECTAKALISLGWCPGWSETSLRAQVIFLVLSCCGSTVKLCFRLKLLTLYLFRLKLFKLLLAFHLFCCFYFMMSWLFVFLSRLVFGAGCGIHLYRFVIIAFSSSFQIKNINHCNMSWIMRKPVYVIFEEQSCRSACASAQSNFRVITTNFLGVQIFRKITVASLYSWAGQFESYLVTNPEDRFSLDMTFPWFSVDMSPRLGPLPEIFGQVIIGYNDNANGEIVLSPDNPQVPENTTEPFLFVTRHGGVFGEVWLNQQILCFVMMAPS